MQMCIPVAVFAVLPPFAEVAFHSLTEALTELSVCAYLISEPVKDALRALF